MIDAKEFDTLIGKAVSRAFHEGIMENKMNFSDAIGTLELHKAQLLRIHGKMLEDQLKQQNQPRIVMPPNGGKLPPMPGA